MTPVRTLRWWLSKAVVCLQAATLPGYASRAPVLKGGASVKATSSSGAEAGFDLTFQMNSAGSVKFIVMYAKVYARFMDTYVVFDNTVSPHPCWPAAYGFGLLQPDYTVPSKVLFQHA